MIKRLRRRFITTAMLSVFCVLFLIVGAINVMNYRSVEKSADQTLRILRDNGGSIPEQSAARPGSGESATQNSPSGEDPKDENTADKSTSDSTLPAPPEGDTPREREQERSDAERPFSTRYFSVTLTKKGEAVSSDLTHIAAVSETEAENYAADLYKKGKKSGYIDDYEFTVLKENGNTVYIFLDCTEGRRNFRQFLLLSIGVSLIGLIGVFLLLLLLSRRILRPVEESYAKQKRFITDASHEIKTPLAIIRANMDVLSMDDEDNKWIRSTEHQIDRLTKLTEKLVFLSRMDEENQSLLHMEDFDLSAAAGEILAGYESLAKSCGKTLSVSIAPDIRMYGDEAMIRQLLSLLLDNAMKYSDPEGRITFILERSGKNIRIVQTNTVPEGTLAVGNHPEFFDRFYRADPSRNSRRGSFGIGLSVAQSIVSAHKGKITAKSPTDGEIVFTVDL